MQAIGEKPKCHGKSMRIFRKQTTVGMVEAGWRKDRQEKITTMVDPVNLVTLEIRS